MDNEIYLIGEVGYEITLDSVINSINKVDKTKPINVNIHSMGGSVYEGLAIYNYLKGLDVEVNTFSSGLVASIASVFFLAGKNRTINKLDNFLIHLPSGGAKGNAEDFEKVAKELRDIEDKIASIYEKETKITKDEAILLMKNDEMLEVEFLKEKGFVNNIVEFKAVAKLTNKNMSEQLTKKDAENLFEKFGNKLKEFFNKEEEPTNKIVQDANGVEIDFINLMESDNINVGADAIIDSKKASGDYTMPSGEIYKFDNGKLSEIVLLEETETEKLQNKIDDLKSELHKSAELIEEKETEVKEFKNKFESLEVEFIEIKNKVTSTFDYDKKDKKEEDVKKIKSRKLFKY